MNEASRPDPRTLEELQEQLIADRNLPPEEIGKRRSALDSPLAMRLWDEFLRR